ncbi:MAG: hypothetical protein OEW12_07895 [Deltaproteobacteria bacterium]|nr:hypothetical protein [Deltaproteobacteria bacterium]
MFKLSGAAMVYNTVTKIAKKLEDLSSHNVPISSAFDLLAAHSRTIEELVVVEVMRESYLELAGNNAGSESRSARIPSKALSR